MNIEALYKIFLVHPLISTDSRTIQKDSIFFALKGENFNGNLFAKDALDKGAAYSVVDEFVDSNDERIIQVENVLETLQQLAKHHRQQFTIPFIAITGSNGKTTTKELVSTVLATHYITYTTQGNLNNHIGVPLTLLSIKKDAQIAVIEMGANHQKEIESYCSYTLPTHGIITNCGKAHLEGFGSEEGIRKGKGELFDFLRQHKGCAFIFNDYAYLQTMSKGIEQVIEYGTHKGLVKGNLAKSTPFVSVNICVNKEEITLHTQLVGAYNLPNILCAVAVGVYCNVPVEKIKCAIESYTPSNSRSQLLTKETNHFILDAYNANPSSMKAAIENFANIQADNKILILGAMMELGAESIKEHQNIVTLLEQYTWTNVILTGGDFAKVKHHYTYMNNAETVGLWLKENQFQHTYFLIKGSRSFQMEKVLQ
ncbi:MAG: UDP-N-acetylmuramoyl-tripeptide--D-alanyl-D-alanine ligase [Chitinophagaceae bacterium]|nr:UDP-N-acetylmuramoyl-tripeptide--D-alanyl-D-alanine ligase [Chitinophagaceae bacterium]MCW5904246.1 UDP-N-acetylmuramoyl-tripeptide--D-alanyl-D-alanine ligase [Chitinophagaceae bacterium]